MDLIMAVTRYKEGRSNIMAAPTPDRRLRRQRRKKKRKKRSREEDEEACMLPAADRYRGKEC